MIFFSSLDNSFIFADESKPLKSFKECLFKKKTICCLILCQEKIQKMLLDNLMSGSQIILFTLSKTMNTGASCLTSSFVLKSDSFVKMKSFLTVQTVSKSFILSKAETTISVLNSTIRINTDCNLAQERSLVPSIFVFKKEIVINLKLQQTSELLL